MQHKLTKGLDEKGLENFKYEYEKSFKFRQHLTKVLEKEIESVHASMRNEENFNESWAYKQADLVAQDKALRKVIGMLK